MAPVNAAPRATVMSGAHVRSRPRASHMGVTATTRTASTALMATGRSGDRGL